MHSGVTTSANDGGSGPGRRSRSTLTHDCTNSLLAPSGRLGITASCSTIVSPLRGTKSVKMTFWLSQEWRRMSETHSLSTKWVAKDPTRSLCF